MLRDGGGDGGRRKQTHENQRRGRIAESGGIAEDGEERKQTHENQRRGRIAEGGGGKRRCMTSPFAEKPWRSYSGLPRSVGQRMAA